MDSIRVIYKNKSDKITAGFVVHCADGYRFLPHFQSKPSRKGWPTPEAAIKRYKELKLEYR